MVPFDQNLLCSVLKFKPFQKHTVLHLMTLCFHKQHLMSLKDEGLLVESELKGDHYDLSANGTCLSVFDDAGFD